jgi:hypothetical protein
MGCLQQVLQQQVPTAYLLKKLTWHVDAHHCSRTDQKKHLGKKSTRPWQVHNVLRKRLTWHVDAHNCCCASQGKHLGGEHHACSSSNSSGGSSTMSATTPVT